MKHLSAIFTFICLTTTAFGQQPQFDIETFNQHVEKAEWLYNYDKIAWRTSDSILAYYQDEMPRLGKEWFCYQDPKNIWHAIYGKYQADQFDLVFHFKVDTAWNIARVYEPVDTTILHSYSRALNTALLQIKLLQDTVNLKMNQFIKRNDDGTFQVWLLPAFQTNWTAVYGGEFIYKISRSGKEVLQDLSYYQGNFRGLKVGEPREVWLDYRDIDKPTLGGVFFVIYYREYFTNIYLDTNRSLTTLTKADGAYAWIHSVKEQPSKKTKREKKNK